MFKLLVLFFSLSLSIFSFSGTKIIGGLKPEVDSKILQSTVSLIAEYKGELRSFCTGTVIAPNIVLTAAHCVGSVLTKDVYISSGVKAYQGHYTKVAKFKYFYKNYFRTNYGDGELGQQDIALLQTETNLNLQPVEIGLPSNLSGETSLIMTGYGVTSIEADNSESDSLWDTGNLFYLFGNVFSEIAGAKVTISEQTDKRTAGGDSGGPLYERTNDRLVLHGILSGGGDLMEQVEGEEAQVTKHISEYTHPYFYLDWMNCALRPEEKISTSYYRSEDQKACDGLGFQDIQQLASFNKAQCEKQWPGFSMTGEGIGWCSPASSDACNQLGEMWETAVEWNEDLKECTPKE